MAQSANRKVLVIEDFEASADILREGLELAGFTVEVANDGETGLDAVHAFSPDLVLLDLMLPRMDGWQVLENMRADEKTAQVPVMFMTAYMSSQEEAEMKRAKKLGCCGFFRKPFDLNNLVDSIRNELGTA